MVLEMEASFVGGQEYEVNEDEAVQISQELERERPAKEDEEQPREGDEQQQPQAGATGGAASLTEYFARCVGGPGGRMGRAELEGMLETGFGLGAVDRQDVLEDMELAEGCEGLGFEDWRPLLMELMDNFGPPADLLAAVGLKDDVEEEREHHLGQAQGERGPGQERQQPAKEDSADKNEEEMADRVKRSPEPELELTESNTVLCLDFDIVLQEHGRETISSVACHPHWMLSDVREAIAVQLVRPAAAPAVLPVRSCITFC